MNLVAQLANVSHKVEPGVKLVADGAAVATVAGTLIGLLPPVAALFTIIWTGIQIYDWADKRRIAAKVIVEIEQKETKD